MAKQKYVLIEGPNKPGAKVPRPGIPGTYRMKSGRFYNSDGYKPGVKFKRVVALDAHHMDLIADKTVNQVGGYLNAEKAEEARQKLDKGAAKKPPADGGKGK